MGELTREQIDDYRRRVRDGGRVGVGEADTLCNMALLALSASRAEEVLRELVRVMDERRAPLTPERFHVRVAGDPAFVNALKAARDLVSKP